MMEGSYRICIFRFRFLHVVLDPYREFNKMKKLQDIGFRNFIKPLYIYIYNTLKTIIKSYYKKHKKTNLIKTIKNENYSTQKTIHAFKFQKLILYFHNNFPKKSLNLN